jgi:hypothetical protein
VRVDKTNVLIRVLMRRKRAKIEAKTRQRMALTKKAKKRKSSDGRQTGGMLMKKKARPTHSRGSRQQQHGGSTNNHNNNNNSSSSSSSSGSRVMDCMSVQHVPLNRLQEKTVAELREFLRSNGIAMAGTKIDLIRRIRRFRTDGVV